MIQKFLIVRDQENNALTIKEFAILDRVLGKIEYQTLDEGDFSLICEQTYNDKIIETEIFKGKHAIISAIRTQNLFPISSFAYTIADSIIDLYSSQSSQPIELMFNDSELL